MPKLRHIAGTLALTLALILPAVAASADNYPSRPIKIIVPFGAGGPTDVFTRAIADELQKSLHTAVVQENRPGAGTTIGTEVVAKAAPDGYTLLMVSGTQTVNETLYSHKQYHLMKDLVPIAPLIESDLVLVVNPKLPVKSVNELIDYAKANPGKLNFGSSGPGSNYHMAAELLKHLTGIDIVQMQIRVANGEKLPWKQKDIQFRGHAIECRINAEHPSTFVPSPGKLTNYHAPGGPGIRVDSHVYHGYYVPPHYDSMIGKLIAYGDTRDQAIARMRGALMEMVVEGIHTNIPLHQTLMHDAAFIAGGTSIHYLEHKLAEEKA